MTTVILVIHVILAICIIIAVLLQKSEGGGLASEDLEEQEVAL